MALRRGFNPSNASSILSMTVKYPTACKSPTVANVEVHNRIKFKRVAVVEYCPTAVSIQGNSNMRQMN